MHVITRYAEVRLKSIRQTKVTSEEEKSNTLELNDSSLENNNCGAEKQSGETQGAIRYKRKGSLSKKCRKGRIG